MSISNIPVVKNGVQSIWGTGSDKLVLNLSQDFGIADAQFTVMVDGKQVGGVFSVTATTNSGSRDQFTLLGDWGAGAHDVQISFINDYYNTATGVDGNLRIAGINFNGTSLLSSAVSMYSNGSRTFSGEIAAAAPKVINGTNGNDVLVGTSASETITAGRGTADVVTGGGGHDTFVMNKGDGYTTITDFVASGIESDILRISGYMISNFDDLKLHMRQSTGGTVVELAANNVVILKNVQMKDLTAANFEILNSVAAPTAVSQTAGTGSSTLVLKLTQDYYTGGNAQYTVKVDGVQVGGVFNASAVRMSGQQDTLTLKGAWAAGANHVVTVTFLNDAFNATTLEDRNLIIESATMNGVNIAAAAHAQGTNGAWSFDAPIAAPVVTAPVVTLPPPSHPSDSSGSTDIVADVTHDLFDVASGMGAKVISGFSATGAGSDVLRLSDFGLVNGKAAGTSFTSFAAIKAVTSQVGSDTLIKLSATDTITLKGVNASDLTASNFSFVSKLDGSMQAVANNGWIVFNNSWGSTDLTYGKDYKMTASYDADRLTTGTTFTWDYGAARHDYTKVLGYPSVMFGYDTFGNAGYVSDSAKALPVQIANLDTFKTSFNVGWGGDKAGYDVSYDIWLTNKPNGIWSDITNEVMIWLHKGDMNTYGELVGTYSDGTYSANIYHIGTYTALVPDKDYTVGSIDVADVLSKLSTMGIVSSSEYVNQIDLGAEPWKGSGSLTINSLSYSIESHDASGVVTKDYADGGATQVTKIGTAKADVLSADGAKIASLTGGAGNDIFQFTKGQTGAVTVEDFHALTTASAEHDLLKFVGYGAGATLTHDSGDAWTIHYTGGEDHITLHNVTSLSASDYSFV